MVGFNGSKAMREFNSRHVNHFGTDIKFDHSLDELPFSTGSFDFVRMCKIAMGVPENKWHHLLEV
jgi:hypothetical protein